MAVCNPPKPEAGLGETPMQICSKISPAKFSSPDSKVGVNRMQHRSCSHTLAWGGRAGAGSRQLACSFWCNAVKSPIDEIIGSPSSKNQEAPAPEVPTAHSRSGSQTPQKAQAGHNFGFLLALVRMSVHRSQLTPKIFPGQPPPPAQSWCVPRQ